MHDDSSHILAWTGNIVSVGAIATSFMGYVPGIAALVALIWYLIQISESATVQRWVSERRMRKLARLKARVLMLEAQSRPRLMYPNDEA